MVLRNQEMKDEAIRLIQNPKLPGDTRLTFERGDKRTLDQNAMLWPLLTKISKEVEWYGQYLTPDDWKHIFTAAHRHYEAVPGIDRGTMVVLGQSTSRMTKEQFSDLIEIILAFGAAHGVDLTDPREKQENAA
ncbi:recombination protein NinB [Oricola thermophila]|nr:recombination protein NinB [Oricola thermophila]